MTKDELNVLSLQLYNVGAYSPKYGPENQAMPGIEILDEVQDCKKLEKLRSQIKQGGIKEKKFAVYINIFVSIL